MDVLITAANSGNPVYRRKIDSNDYGYFRLKTRRNDPIRSDEWFGEYSYPPFPIFRTMLPHQRFFFSQRYGDNRSVHGDVWFVTMVERQSTYHQWGVVYINGTFSVVERFLHKTPDALLKPTPTWTHAYNL
jgi:hypothetical protein